MANSIHNVKLEFSERHAFAQVILWEEGKIISSQRLDHEQLTSQSIENFAKEFVTAWNLDNKTADNSEWPGTPLNRAAPLASEPPTPNLPPGFVAGPVPDSVKATSNPYADLIPKADKAGADDLPKPVVPKVVTVKYRGPVNLAPFKCDRVTRSSFVERVCYDAANSYMLIDLSGTWYHYCEIDADTVSGLMAAGSMGGFYNQSIKGRFDCRTHRVPHY